MAVEPERNPQSYDPVPDGVNEEFAKKLAEWRKAAIPETKQSSSEAKPSYLDIERKDGDVIVKAGLRRDITFVYPENTPLNVRVTGEGVSQKVVVLSRALFVTVAAIQLWEPFRTTDPKVTRDFEEAKAFVVSGLADLNRLDIVDAGRLMSGLPGIDRSALVSDLGHRRKIR